MLAINMYKFSWLFSVTKCFANIFFEQISNDHQIRNICVCVKDFRFFV